MDIISDEKSIEMIHLIFESMVRSKEGRICIQKKKKKGYVDWSDDENTGAGRERKQGD